MHMACDRIPCDEETVDYLKEQLTEIHERQIFHTDTRFCNILPFSINTNDQGHAVVREYIIDYDWSVSFDASDKNVEIDISIPGARREHAISVKNMRSDSEVKIVKWSVLDDYTALQKCISILTGDFNKTLSLPSYSSSMSQMLKPSGNLFADFVESDRKRTRTNKEGSL